MKRKTRNLILWLFTILPFIMLGILIAAGILAAVNSRRIYNRLKRTEK